MNRQCFVSLLLACLIGVAAACTGNDGTAGSGGNPAAGSGGSGSGGTSSAGSGGSPVVDAGGSDAATEADCLRACQGLAPAEGDGVCSAPAPATNFPAGCDRVRECATVIIGEPAQAGCQPDCTYVEDIDCMLPSLRGSWQVTRTYSGDNGNSSCPSDTTTLVTNWMVIMGGDFNWPLLATASGGGTSFTTIYFRQTDLDVVGSTPAMSSGSTMMITLSLDTDGNAFSGTETIVTTDGCTLTRSLQGYRL